MSLDLIRKDIDVVDKQIKELLLTRLNLAEKVVATKISDKTYNIYRQDREEAIFANMCEGVAENQKTEFLAFIRKMIEISRMHQYAILHDEVDGLLEPYFEDVEIPENPTSVKFEMIRANVPGQMAAICGLISDYGFNLTEIKQLDNSKDNSQSRLWLTVIGDVREDKMRKMLLQLAQESEDFSILRVA